MTNKKDTQWSGGQVLLWFHKPHTATDTFKTPYGYSYADSLIPTMLKTLFHLFLCTLRDKHSHSTLIFLFRRKLRNFINPRLEMKVPVTIPFIQVFLFCYSYYSNEASLTFFIKGGRENNFYDQLGKQLQSFLLVTTDVQRQPNILGHCTIMYRMVSLSCLHLWHMSD